MSVLKVKTTFEKTKLPSKRDEDSGYDIYMSPELSMLTIEPSSIVAVPTDLRIEIPSGYTFLIKERGSTGISGLAVRAGVVDSGFRGEIKIVLNNTNRYPIFIGTEEAYKNMSFRGTCIFYSVEKAIAQGVIIKNENWPVEKVNTLSDSERGDGMVGSSGK